METIALYVVAATLGSMVFFAAGIAPTVFQSLPEAEAGREICGLDTRGISLNGYFNSTGVASTQNLMLFAECTSSLRIGQGRAMEVIV